MRARTTGTALRTAARRHSADMARYSYFSHTSATAARPWQRMRAAGYYYGSAENIAAGQTTASRSWPAWMNSYGHRRTS